ncbi:MAG TPA: putative Ig domain-containing protein, partial [Streptosporangiaceae bacterium]|nr:putative Ig domain-containing protein [Streptosporangiaceae bacterium]
PGLAINATSGLISSTATTTGYYPVTVTASDTTGDSATATFTWHVETPTVCGHVCCGGVHTQIPCSRNQHTTG